MRSFLICLFTIFCIPTSFACNISSGWEPWEPYQFEQDGKITGLDNDLLAAIGQQMQCDIKFVKRPWKRTLEEIKAGMTDVAPGASVTPEREEYALFSAPYRQETMSLFILKKNEDKFSFSNFDDFQTTDFKLGITRGYYYGEQMQAIIDNNVSKLLLREATNDEQNIEKLLGNRIDGILLDPYVGTYLLKNQGKLEQVMIHPVAINSDDIYMMFSKKSTEQSTIDQFNQALEAIKASGEYEKIVNQYLQ
jgi:polar amino acid transport system substrate-binding protein